MPTILSRFNRPVLLFVITWIFLFNFSVIPIVNLCIKGELLYGSLPEQFYWFAGAAFGLYSTSKTVERLFNRDPNAQMEVTESVESK